MDRMGAAVPGTRRLPSSVRLAALAAGLSLFVAACAATPPPPTNVNVQSHGDLVVQVVASLNDAGRAPSVTMTKDGTPAIVYLLLKAKLKAGQVPPAVIAGVPQPPAVILAAQSGPVWTHVSVTKQDSAPIAQGAAEGLAFKDGTAGPTVRTAVAVDDTGKYHVAWSTAAGLFYNTDASGSFGDPQKVVGGGSDGASIALAADGTPWISFYQGSTVRAAHLAGGSWAIEDVATGSAGTAVLSAVGIAGDGEPMVAYGDGGTTRLARRAGGSWTSESVPGQGGYGVSMAVDGSGNPHLAYYDGAGNVHHAHSVGGAPWEMSDVASVAGASGPSKDWSTGIALDDKGVHHVTWADTSAKQIGYATNEGGDFSRKELSGSLNGVTPSIAVSGDGKNVAIAWYGTANGDLEVATSAAAGLSIAFSPPPVTATSAPPPAASCSSSGTKLQIAAKNVAFDKDCLAAPAGKPFTVTFDNQEAVPHNFAIYTDSTASQLLGGAPSASDIVIGPQQVDYQVDPIKKGTYYFQCDIHPTVMNGAFVAD
jgi:plastocyanin